MHKLKTYLIAFILLSFTTHLYGNVFDYVTVSKIKNNKEAQSVFLKKKHKEKLLLEYPDVDLYQKLENIFYATVIKYDQESKHRCELNLMNYFSDALEEEGLNPLLIPDYLKLLRMNQSIDDILLEFAQGIYTDVVNLKEIEQKRKHKRAKKRKYNKDKLVQNNNLENLYYAFKDQGPDEVNTCLYQEFNYILTNLNDKKKDKPKKLKYKKKLKIMKKLNLAALNNGLISSLVFEKVEYLRKDSFITQRMIRLDDYFYIVLNAKDKMVPNKIQYMTNNIEEEDKFSTERMRRFSKLTRRKKLYEKYDPTQIIMLSQIFQNASRRAGSDPDIETHAPMIVQEYTTYDESGNKVTKVEKIVLDPQSQFNWARRMMRSEMVSLEAMDVFIGKKIFFNEIVMAAFETGYISIEDLHYAVQYDDLWNPSMSKIDRIINFFFKAGTIGSFFLPPPFNILAPLAISITEGVVENKREGGKGNENPSTIIN